MSKRTGMRLILLAGGAALALAACGKKEAPPPVEDSPGAEISAPSGPDMVDYAAVAAAAVADPRRPEEDRDADARRRPAEALEFMQIAPGLSVYELEAGTGYYTELMAYAVGPDGSVVMHNPQGFRSFVGEAIDARLADGRLANTREAASTFDALDAADASIDLVTWVQGPHELYYKPEGLEFGDPVAAYGEIFRILKPGGLFVVIDHSAEPGAPETTGHDLHRIDKAIVLGMAEAAGFTLDGESDFLANPEDPLTIGVFDPSIRGYTDQFALRFKKPE